MSQHRILWPARDFEWMDTDENIRRLILENASTDLISAAARKGGMRTLAEDGWRLVAAGVTTVEEVLSVTTSKEVESATKNRRPEIPSRKLRWPAELDFPCPRFHTKVCRADGKIAEGQLDAPGRPDALRQMEALGLRPVNLAEKAGGKNGSVSKNGAGLPAGLEGLGKISFKFERAQGLGEGTGKFHAAAVEPARGGRAVEPRAGDSAQGSLVADGAGQVEGNPRPRRGRHVAGRRDVKIAGNFSARLCRDGGGGRGGRLSRRGAGANRGIPVAREGPEIESHDGDAVSMHPILFSRWWC